MNGHATVAPHQKKARMTIYTSSQAIRSHYDQIMVIESHNDPFRVISSHNDYFKSSSNCYSIPSTCMPWRLTWRHLFLTLQIQKIFVMKEYVPCTQSTEKEFCEILTQIKTGEVESHVAPRQVESLFSAWVATLIIAI